MYVYVYVGVCVCVCVRGCVVYVGQGQREEERLNKGNQIENTAPSPLSSNDDRAPGPHRELTHFQVDR